MVLVCKLVSQQTAGSRSFQQQLEKKEACPRRVAKTLVGCHILELWSLTSRESLIVVTNRTHIVGFHS